MAKPSITDASSITADVVLQLGKHFSAQSLRSLQAKLTGTVREIRGLTGGNTLPGRIGEKLSLEQIQLLRDAAKLIESVNTNIEHAKEKRKRDENEAKRRQEARDAQAKRLVAETFPLPYESLDQILEILKTALNFNRAGQFLDFYSALEYNLNLRNYLSPTKTRKLIGWNKPQDYWMSIVRSLRNEFMQTVEHEIGYDDGSSVQERLHALKQKVADRLSVVHLSADEEETLRLWSEALSPAEKQEGA
ncbi:hypothetical protein CCU68_18230 [Pseudomonas gingeri NCPPB 3146 = LMG 5327]|uniref:Uncharacterized protein n=2 Tax=Pseudomonas gingeri TaxID=117681 RepID=A0A7Y8CF20_9PSED|nr:hypothetical protein [Pseudomonas gingeri]NWC16484.1 hypothetical protein [Pseudomonas gingeri]PNQ91154.1 hypothetical protein CCU68_18230 [Pseudomonas gingeri NCPPB 3146 = LMG 5327]